MTHFVQKRCEIDVCWCVSVSVRTLHQVCSVTSSERVQVKTVSVWVANSIASFHQHCRRRRRCQSETAGVKSDVGSEMNIGHAHAVCEKLKLPLYCIKVACNCLCQINYVTVHSIRVRITVLRYYVCDIFPVVFGYRLQLESFLRRSCFIHLSFHYHHRYYHHKSSSSAANLLLSVLRMTLSLSAKAFNVSAPSDTAYSERKHSA